MYLKFRLTQFMDGFKESRRVQKVSEWKTFLRDLCMFIQTCPVTGLLIYDAVFFHYMAFLGDHFPPIPEHHEPIRECSHGTRVGVIQDIKTWLDKGGSLQNIFWLRGYPGSGKSTIAFTLVKELKRRSPKPFVSSFFFHRTWNWSTARNLWGSVMLDLCKLDIMFTTAVVESLQAESLDRTDTPEDLFRRLIAEPISACEQAPGVQRPVFVIIDALDECQGFDGNRDWERDQILLAVKCGPTFPRISNS